jgi:hypothetical protein
MTELRSRPSGTERPRSRDILKPWVYLVVAEVLAFEGHARQAGVLSDCKSHLWQRCHTRRTYPQDSTFAFRIRCELKPQTLGES